MNPYGDLKVAYHVDRIAALRDGGRCAPVQVQLIISDLCNHDCSFCAYRMSGYPSNQNFAEVDPETGEVNNNPKRFIPTEKAIEIVHDAARIGVKAIQFTGGGEPTVHPGHLKIMGAAQDCGMETALVTNGALLRDGWERVYDRMTWVRVSLDAGKPETYAQIRSVKESQFGRTLDNIARIAGLQGPTVGVSFIVTRDNYSEIPAAARLASQSGSASIRFGAIYTPENGGYYGDEKAAIRFALDSAAGYANEHFSVYDLFDQRLADLESPEYALCGYQHFNVYVGGDLRVYRCCNTAYNDRGDLGSLKDQTFYQWWSSEATTELYKGFDARGCERCVFNGKNRILNQLIAEPPAHVNFA